MPINNIEDALVTYLLSKTGLTSLIGNRIEPMKQSQEMPMPGVIYECMEDKPILGLCTGLRKAVYSISALSYDNDVTNSIYFWLLRNFNKLQYIDMSSGGSSYKKVLTGPVNGFAIKHEPFIGTDKYPFVKSVFISLQYADPI